MIAQSPAVPVATTTPGVAVPHVSRGLLDILAAFIDRAAKAPTASTSSERYWTSVARGL